MQQCKYFIYLLLLFLNCYWQLQLGLDWAILFFFFFHSISSLCFSEIVMIRDGVYCSNHMMKHSKKEKGSET